VVEYCRVGQATEDNIIPHTRFACWMIKDIDSHLKYVILIALLRQQSLGERISVLRYTYCTWPFLLNFMFFLLLALKVDINVPYFGITKFCVLGIGFKVFVSLEQIYLCALINVSAVTSNIRRSIPKGILHLLRNCAKLSHDHTALPTERKNLHRHYRDKFGLA